MDKSQDKESVYNKGINSGNAQLKLQYVDQAFSRYLHTCNSTTLHCTIEQC